MYLEIAGGNRGPTYDNAVTTDEKYLLKVAEGRMDSSDSRKGMMKSVWSTACTSLLKQYCVIASRVKHWKPHDRSQICPLFEYSSKWPFHRSIIVCNSGSIFLIAACEK